MVSIVVPIYNVEEFLAPCIESILNSDYKDFELILVDDGSTDCSGEICDNYAKKDSRVCVIHKTNAGLSEARNSGLMLVKGEYVLFIDGDDVIHPQMISVLIELIQSGDYDFSMIYGEKVPPNGYSELITHSVDQTLYEKEVLGSKDLMNRIFGTNSEGHQYIVVWNKLYKINVIDGLTFKKTSAEETEWSMQVSLRTHKCILLKAPLYYWVQRSTSLTHSGFNMNMINRLESYQLCYEDVSQNHLEYKDLCLEKLFKVLLSTRYNARDTLFVREAKSLISRTYDKIVGDFLKSRIPLFTKVVLLVFYHIPYAHVQYMKWRAKNCSK